MNLEWLEHIRRIAVGIALAGGVASGGLAQAATSSPRTTAFAYEPGTGRLTRAIVEPDNSALCLVTEIGYDAYGNANSVTSRNCNGAAPEAAAPTGDPVFQARTEAASFAAGTTLIDGMSYAWSTGQFATGETNAMNHAETREYDPRFGTVAKLTGPNGLITSWRYDRFGRPMSEMRADNTSTQLTYGRCADAPGVCPASGAYYVTATITGAPSRRAVYDSLQREVAVDTLSFDGTTWARTETEYDSLGRVSRQSRPYFISYGTPVWTAYQYDVWNRVSVVTEPDPGNGLGSLVTTTTYSGLTATASRNTNTTPAQTNSTTWDSVGRVVQTFNALGQYVTFGYDLLGNLTSNTANGVIKQFTYDVRGRKTASSDPDAGAWSYAYNALSELIRQTDAKGQVATYAYDRLSRPTLTSRPDLTHTWSYDACTTGVGKLCQVSASNDYGRTITYDGFGRVWLVGTTIGGTLYPLRYDYDLSGRLSQLTYPTGFAVSNEYNYYGHLRSIQRADGSGTVFWRANAKNAAGAVTSETLGNGASTSRGYDSLYRLTSVVSTSASGTLQDLGYGYDKAGNVSTRADYVQSVTESYSYDVLNRLKQISGSLTTRSFDFDALGNVTYKSDVGTYTYPAANAARPHAVSSVTNGGVPNSITASYAYDANGNLTSASGAIYPASGSVSFSRTLSYTSFNKPLTISQTQGGYGYSYTYTYGAEEERVRLVTVRPDDTLASIYIHPGGGAGALLYEKETRQSDGRVEHKHFVTGGAGLVGVYVTKSIYVAGDGPQMRYMLRDSLESNAVIVNESGAATERLGYEGFGERRYPSGAPQDRASPLVGIQTDRGFTGHEHLDEANLIHMNGRVYDPALGRFMTPDPTVPYVLNLQSHNRYTYVHNNPMRNVDPSGFLGGQIYHTGSDNSGEDEDGGDSGYSERQPEPAGESRYSSSESGTRTDTGADRNTDRVVITGYWSLYLLMFDIAIGQEIAAKQKAAVMGQPRTQERRDNPPGKGMDSKKEDPGQAKNAQACAEGAKNTPSSNTRPIDPGALDFTRPTGATAYPPYSGNSSSLTTDQVIFGSMQLGAVSGAVAGGIWGVSRTAAEIGRAVGFLGHAGALAMPGKAAVAGGALGWAGGVLFGVGVAVGLDQLADSTSECSGG